MTNDGPRKTGNTGRLNSKQRQAYTIPNFTEFGSRFTPQNIEFRPVPHNYKTLKDASPWYILLKFGAPAPRITTGLAIYEDVVVGRGSTGPQQPDVDVSALNAHELGVSRSHALLRPTSRNLFLLDVGSTNGTYVNAIPIGKGMAQTIKSGDTVALAGLSFEVEIIARPGEAAPKKPEGASGVDDTMTKPLTQLIAGFSGDESTVMLRRSENLETKETPTIPDKQTSLARLRASFKKPKDE